MEPVCLEIIKSGGERKREMLNKRDIREKTQDLLFAKRFCSLCFSGVWICGLSCATTSNTLQWMWWSVLWDAAWHLSFYSNFCDKPLVECTVVRRFSSVCLAADLDTIRWGCDGNLTGFRWGWQAVQWISYCSCNNVGVILCFLHHQ